MIDENEILANIAVDSLERAGSLFGKSIDDARKTVSVKLRSGFGKYKNRAAERYGFVRTLLHRDKPIPLEDLYVKTTLQHGDDEFDDEAVIGQILASAHILVQGTAGGGKSIFLRFLNLVIARSSGGVLPLFFELKLLNGQDGVSLLDALLSHIKKNLPDLSKSTFIELIDEGRIVILLDGFDEIDYNIREQYAREISEFCKEHEKSSIVVSSRPDDLVSSVERFSVYRVMPFKKHEAVELLGRLPYDQIVKDKFIQAVNVDLYEKHPDFLSNPLLITMMLMTYHQFAEIPSKIHIFYQQAFETLFSWHDSSKDVFKRKSYTELPIDEFQRVFAYFCASSYGAEQFSFSESEARQRLKSAISAEGVKADVTDFLKDLLESTCLLQKDGMEITFVHRSFQEYFTAVFISRLSDRMAKKAIDAVLKRASADLVLPMAYEINPALIEKAWSLPTVTSLAKKISGVNAREKPHELLSILFESYYTYPTTVWLSYQLNSIWSQRLRGLHRIYETGIPPLDKDKCEAGRKRLWDDLKTSQKLRNELKAAVSVNLERFVLAKEFGYLSLKFKSVPDYMISYIDVTPWAESQVVLINSLKDKIESRVKSRRNAFDDMFR